MSIDLDEVTQKLARKGLHISYELDNDKYYFYYGNGNLQIMKKYIDLERWDILERAISILVEEITELDKGEING